MIDPQTQRCKDCAIRDRSLCAALSDHDLQALSEIGRSKTVPKGAVVTWAGDDNMICANLVSGALKLSKSTADGREQAVGLLFSGDFVGQPFSESSDITAIALTETDLCVYPRGKFENVLAEKGALERALLERTIRSLNDARDRQLTLARKGAQARIAGFLEQLSANEGGREICLPMSRGDIADYLGLTIETVSRQFTELKKQGVIAFDRAAREIEIVDPAALQALSEE